MNLCKRPFIIVTLLLLLTGCNQPPSQPATITGRVIAIVDSTLNAKAIAVVTPAQGVVVAIIVGPHRLGTTVVKLRSAKSVLDLKGRRVRVTGLWEESKKGRYIIAACVTELP